MQGRDTVKISHTQLLTISRVPPVDVDVGLAGQSLKSEVDLFLPL